MSVEWMWQPGKVTDAVGALATGNETKDKGMEIFIAAPSNIYPNANMLNKC